MTNDIISVVIPCYNAEKYINKCLESVLSQTYSNLEVIVVNDGSTDNTKKCLEKYSNDKRVVIINQKNGGEAAARNRGIEAATGKYLGFVDSDDYIDQDMYSTLYTSIIKEDADMAVCNFNLIYEDQRKDEESYSQMIDATINIWDDVYGYFARFCACPKPNNYVWTKLYKREIIISANIRFELYPHSADTLFLFKLLPSINKTVFINRGLYNYNQRKDSNTHTIALKGNIAEIYAKTFESLAEHYKTKGYDEFLKVLPLHAYTRLRSVFFYSRLAGHDEEIIIKNILQGFKGKQIYNYLTDRK